MDEAIKILEKEIEMIRGAIDSPFVGEEYVKEMSDRIPKIERAIWCLKNLVE